MCHIAKYASLFFHGFGVWFMLRKPFPIPRYKKYSPKFSSGVFPVLSDANPMHLPIKPHYRL